MTTPEPTTVAPQFWGILELFGHGRIAGAISAQPMGSEIFIRVDVPEVTHADETYVDGVRQVNKRTIQAHTKAFNAKSIYSCSYVDEAAATLAAHKIKHEPVRSWELREALEELPLADRRMLLGGPDVA